ncbi:MAG: divergent polysaccharide deacetylase family protein [Alphaproteobacteria bacterium]|nr:divergent polysaccharide deacetylase family protein [Alphaproteobacteria bacterium]
MARKPRKQKTRNTGTVGDEPIVETSSIPRPAVLIILAIVLLILGLTVGVVIDVASRPEPAVLRDTASAQRSARPSRNVPPPRIEAPRAPSIFDRPEATVSETGEDAVGKVAPAIPVLSPLALNAAPVDVPSDWPVIAIVIDDMGLDKRRTGKVLALPGPLTVSYLTYADDLNAQAQRAIDAGHEVMAHIPMEPMGTADPGPGALMSDGSPADLREQLDKYLNGWTGYVGINNHMGSKLTSDRTAMDVVMMELKSRGLMWLDSRTDSSTVGETAAGAVGVPHIGRDVFLDNEDDEQAIALQLAKVESIARREGFAVAIGHPRDATLTALAKWMATLSEKGLALVPVTEALRRRSERRG